MNLFSKAAALSGVTFLALLPGSCMRNNAINQEFGSWSFSGVVIDGATEKSLSGVGISYTDTTGQIRNVVDDTDGKFYISGLPFGERTFVFAYSLSDSSYTSKRVVAASYTEAASLGGVIGDISKIIKLYPLTGSVSGSLVYQPRGTDYKLPAAQASVRILYEDSTMQNMEPALFTAVADSLGNFRLSGLPFAPGGLISFDNFKNKEITFTLASKSLTLFSEKGTEDLGRLVLTTADSTGWTAAMLTSNVLSSDGFGRNGVPVNKTIWYKLPVELEPESADATVNGVGAPMISVRINRDTLFITPVAQMSYDTLMTVNMTGFTNDNERFDLTLDGTARFRTEKSPFPVEANFWSQPWIMKGRFGVGQTLWVRFSAPLDTQSSLYNWAKSAAAATIYGSGSTANAKFRISGDTLFVVPDQRLGIAYNSTIGFNVQCRTADGRYLAFYDFGVNTIDDPLYAVWTNTKDGMGNNRNDMGLRDTMMVVSSVPGFKVVGISGGGTGLVPPGLLLSDVSVRGDTIVYIPSLSMRADTTYSVDFDLKFSDGTIRKDVLAMGWSTKKTVAIIATDTRKNGMYRPLAAFGDSFSVTFSEPIDTSATASVSFRVNIADVNKRTLRSVVHWDGECRTATIKVLDTLPTADFDAPAAYTATATMTRAVVSVTFDLATKAGEQVIACAPDGDPIALHTEKGMCIVNTNLVPNLDGRTSVEKEFTPTTEFPLDGNVEVTFDRPIDTSLMRMDSLSLYAGIHKTGAVIVPAAVSILSDLKTVRIDPVDSLEMKTDYYLWIKGVPAQKIAGAAPINKHGGTFSGKAGAGYLFDNPFRTQ